MAASGGDMDVAEDVSSLLQYLEECGTWSAKEVPLSLIQKLVSKLGHSIQGAIGPSGDTLLFRACQNNRNSIVEYLLWRGATVFKPAVRWPNDFMMAVLGRAHRVVRRLLYHGASVDAIPSVDNLKTALHFACVSGHSDMVEMLLEYGGANPLFCIDIDASDRDKKVSLKGFEACMSTIKGARSVTGRFMSAVRSGDVQLVNALLEQKGWGLVNASYLEANTTPLFVAVSRGDLRMVEVLLENGARLDIACPSDMGLKRCTPLVMAVRKGYADVATLLIEELISSERLPLPQTWLKLEHRTNIDRAMVEKALVEAGEKGQEGVARLLLPHIPFSQRAWLRTMGAAAKNGHTGVLRALFEQAGAERVGILRAVLMKVKPTDTTHGTQPSQRNKLARESLEAMLGDTTPEVLSYLLEVGVVPDSDELDWVSFIKPTSPCWADDTCARLLLEKAAVATNGPGQLEAVAECVLQHGVPHASVLQFLCDAAKAPDELLDGLLRLVVGWRMRIGQLEDEALRRTQLLLDMGRSVEAGLAVHEAAQARRQDILALLVQRGSRLRPAHLSKALGPTVADGHADGMRLIMSQGITMQDMMESKRVTMSKSRRVKAEETDDLWHIMDQADKAQHHDVVRLILEKAGQKASKGRPGLSGCVLRQDYDTAVYYLASGEECKNGMPSPLLLSEPRPEPLETWVALIADLEAVISAAEEADIVSDAMSRLLEREGPCVLNARGGERRWSALTAAASQGHIQIAEALLCRGKGVDVDIKDGQGRTALMHASEAGQAAMATLLLAHKADAGVEDEEGLTAVALAARHGHLETLCLLLRDGPPSVRSLGPALMEACSHGRVDAAEALLDRCKEALRPAMLVAATAGGHSALVHLLVRRVQEDMLDAAHFLFPAMRTAVAHDNADLLRDLLDTAPALLHHRDEGTRDCLLAVAVLWGRTELVRLLLERGAEVGVKDVDCIKDVDAASVLLVACRARCHPDILRLLLHHCDLTVVNPSDQKDATTPLSEACKRGQEDAVALLLDSGADVSPPTAGKVLCMACRRQHLGVVRLLLQRCGTMLSADDAVQVFLAAAQYDPTRRMMEVMEALLERWPLEALAANESARDAHGHSQVDKAIRYAAAVGNHPVASALLLLFPPRFMGDRLCALFDAVRYGHRPIVELLLHQSTGPGRNPQVQTAAAVRADWSYLPSEEKISTRSKAVQGARVGTVLHIACVLGDPAMVGLLLDHRADVTARVQPKEGEKADEYFDMTPLLLACKHGNTECVRALLRHDPTLIGDHDDFGRGALRHAVEGGHAALVEVLVAQGATSSPVADLGLPRQPIQMDPETMRVDVYEIVQQLPVMQRARTKAQGACVKALNVLCNAHDALYRAVASRDVARVSDLLDSHVEGALASNLVNMHLLAPLSQSRYLLGLAVAQNDLPMTTLLINRGARVNMPPSCSVPVLRVASANNQLDMMRLLLSNGADAAIADARDQRTSLMVAVQGGHIAAAKLLLKTPEGRSSANLECASNMTALDYNKPRLDRNMLVELLVWGVIHFDPTSSRVDAQLLGEAPFADVLALYYAKDLFLLSKCRCVHDAAAVGAILPLPLRGRAEAGEPLPSLQVGELPGEETCSVGYPRLRGAEQEECVWPAVATYVVQALKHDLFVELMDMMNPLPELLSDAATGRMGPGRGGVLLESSEDESEEDSDEDEDDYSNSDSGDY